MTATEGDDTAEGASAGATAGGHRQVRFEAPAAATEIVLVRHGETIAFDPGAPFPLLDGHGDPELRPEGREQAAKVAERLATAGRIHAIYVTSLRRTSETAAPLAARLGLEPIVETRLREVRLGEWEGGLYRLKVISADPVAMEMISRERWDVVPGAESNEAFAKRVAGAITDIAARHPGERVVVVTHGGTIGMILSLASGARPFAFVGSDNGALSTIVVSGEQWYVRGFNDVTHLA
jgi:probable phosphoglycerate mutase